MSAHGKTRPLMPSDILFDFVDMSFQGYLGKTADIGKDCIPNAF